MNMILRDPSFLIASEADSLHLTIRLGIIGKAPTAGTALRCFAICPTNRSRVQCCYYTRSQCQAEDILPELYPPLLLSPRTQNNDRSPPRCHCAGFVTGTLRPVCSLLLGELGTRVLKIAPLEGDWAHQLEPRQGNHSVVFLALNHNKTNIALDYRSAAGQEVVQGLDYVTLAA